ncbi:hypothetical protein IEQ34_015193 [Dendrobium chrysotoxum]|uniref:Uncharacterized protein n=1 Tax=Dendrobium chrysotoxum TaxID=161865 RepID=A0AAV7GF84_DENCH|nr:hypothetical protein IEQ34_015193 [Dendrobium chrysotoxum]
MESTAGFRLCYHGLSLAGGGETRGFDGMLGMEGNGGNETFGMLGMVGSGGKANVGRVGIEGSGGDDVGCGIDG